MVASNDPDRVVECGQHGARGPAYVCQHLDLYTPRGFVEGYDPENPGAELFQAWCKACDEVLAREGEWNDVSEEFAKPRLICQACYEEIRQLNDR